MASDGYCRGYVSFAHFLLYLQLHRTIAVLQTMPLYKTVNGCNLILVEVNTGVHTKTASAVQYSFKLNRVIHHKFYHRFKINLSILINIHLFMWF